MPGENVQPLNPNAVEDEDTDVAMHSDENDHDEEESDEQSEHMPFSEIFTGSICSNRGWHQGRARGLQPPIRGI